MSESRKHGMLLWTAIGMLVGAAVGFAIDFKSFMWIYTEADFFMLSALGPATSCYALIGAMFGFVSVRTANRTSRESLATNNGAALGTVESASDPD